MDELHSQLASYGDDFDNRCSPVTQREVEEALLTGDHADADSELPDTGGLAKSTVRNSGRRYRLALVGAVAAAVFLVSFLLLTGDEVSRRGATTGNAGTSEPTPPTTAASTSTTSTSTTTTTVAALPPVEIDWNLHFDVMSTRAELLSATPPVLQLQLGPPPEFDTTDLGTETVIEPVTAAEAASVSGLSQRPSAESSPDGPVYFLGQIPGGALQFVAFESGSNICTASFANGNVASSGCSSGSGYGLTSSGTAWSASVVVPPDTSVVAISTQQGLRVWQRPRVGWARFDIPNWREGSPQPSVTAYDFAGNVIGRWGSDQSVLDAFAATTTTTTPLTGEEALAVVDAYFAAYNDGDFEAILALLPAATAFDEQQFTFLTPGAGEAVSEESPGPWRQRLYLDAAQGTTVSSRRCEVLAVPSEDGTLVICTYSVADAPTQAVGAPPVAVTAEFSLSPAGLHEISESYGNAIFRDVREPFRLWLSNNRPAVKCLDQTVAERWCDDFGDGTTEPERFGNVELWTETGRLISRYAIEWAEFLESNNCSYLDGC